MAKKAVRETFYMGFANDEPNFYRDEHYYESVLHADLFRTRRAALKCYEDVRAVTVERIPKKGRGK